MTDVADQLRGALADRYLIERELGQGGMATVYLALDLRHDRHVALKVLHPELAHAVGPARFLREIRTTARLQHPHILPVFDSGEADGQLWYTMPYIEGESLRARLRHQPKLPIEEAVQIASDVADALAYAHERGIIHRDVKPENVLLSGGHALVADFGIARAVGPTEGDKLTGTGLALGTPAYMSPEQAAGSGALDGRSDQYSLGCVLYEMLAGEQAFTGPTPQAVIARRFMESPPAVRSLRTEVPELLERVVLRALAREPVDRFPTAAEFLRLLARGEGGAAAPGAHRASFRPAPLRPTALTAPPARGGRPARRGDDRGGRAAASVVGLGALHSMSTWSRSRPSRSWLLDSRSGARG